jgi:hypothetical protein
MATVYIYALTDPRTGEIRYVGKTVDLKKRQNFHNCPSMHQKGSCRRAWVMELRELGLRPKLVSLEECSEDTWQERERYWIKRYGGVGKLLNVREGGEFNPPKTDEFKRSIGDQLRGRKRPEVSEKLKIAWQTIRKGYKHPPAVVEQLRRRNKEQFSDPITRERHRQSIKDWYENMSPELRERLRASGAAQLAKVRDPERTGKSTKAWWDSLTPEQRKDFTNRRTERARALVSVEQRRENSHNRWARMTPEQREYYTAKLREALRIRWDRRRQNVP